MLPMKTLLSILVFTAAFAQSLLAQTTTLTFPSIGATASPVRQQSIPVLAGEVFELLTWVPKNPSAIYLDVDGINVPLFVDPNGGPNSFPIMTRSLTVAGPKTVNVSVPSNQELVCTYKLTTATATATVNVASQAVVIPADAAAPVDIIFESSTDLLTWTAAVAGSYAPSTSKRFFRVRAVAH